MKSIVSTYLLGYKAYNVKKKIFKQSFYICYTCLILFEIMNYKKYDFFKTVKKLYIGIYG